MENLKDRVERELKDGILSFWLNKAYDKKSGLFYANVTNDNVVEDGEKGLIQSARNLWSFARVYNYYRDENFLKIALECEVFLDSFRDSSNGGYFWTMDATGNPVNRRKQVYGQAFVIYAYCELYTATCDPQYLDRAMDLYALLEEYTFDRENNGYFEAFAENWDEIADVRLSPVDMNEKKSNNTHLHIVEAYTSLAAVSNNFQIIERLKNVTEVMLYKILSRDTLNFGLFFDEKWNKKSEVVSYGHEIEAFWLIYRAVEVTEDVDFLKKNRDILLKIAENCLDNYLEGELGTSGMYNEDDGAGQIDKNKVWWVQAEACVGFYHAYQLTGEDRYKVATENIWKFIEDYITHESGEWLEFGVDKSTTKSGGYKVMNWKSLYHNSRACVELLERIGDK